MSDNQQLSRREWFRLRPVAPKPKAESHQASIGAEVVGLAPVEHPPNHDNMDLSKLPPMLEALLTAHQVRDLFSDIADCADDVLLMQRSKATPRATGSKPENPESLITARNLLLSGGLPRVQIRYRWQERLWIDTLESKPDGYRIIRIAHAQ